MRRWIRRWLSRRWEKKTIKRLTRELNCPRCDLQTNIIGLWGHTLIKDADLGGCELANEIGARDRLQMFAMLGALNIPIPPLLAEHIMDTIDPMLLGGEPFILELLMQMSGRGEHPVEAFVKHGRINGTRYGQDPRRTDEKSPPDGEWRDWDSDAAGTDRSADGSDGSD